MFIESSSWPLGDDQLCCRRHMPARDPSAEDVKLVEATPGHWLAASAATASAMEDHYRAGAGQQSFALSVREVSWNHLMHLKW